jgi:redox-sensitive bicupin YhaK (pirin superfamily)
VASPERIKMKNSRTIYAKYSGSQHGPITRLIDPSDLGNLLKPFIFLDYFNAEIQPGFGFPMHPHSGIATLTWQPGTDIAYEDTTGQQGVLKAGGLEWMNAGGGAWHKASLMGRGKVTGFQLWVAMPPGVENGPSQGQYVAPEDVAQFAVQGGNVKVLLGALDHFAGSTASPIASHQDMNYLVVTLEANAQWTYTPPAHHDVAFAVGFAGTTEVNGVPLAHQLAVLDGQGSVTVAAGANGTQVLLGSAAKHNHPLVLGSSSVHTSADALKLGMQTIREIGSELRVSGRLG